MNKRSEFKNRLDQKKPIILDGGLATELEANGHDLNTALWSAALLLNQPQAIVQAHLAYLKAGAQIITTATYQASVDGFAGMGLAPAQAEKLMIDAVKLAHQAVSEHQSMHLDSQRPLIAASIGPYGAYLADGSEYSGEYGVTDEVLIAFHNDRLKLLDGSDIDILACETIPSLQEAQVLAKLLTQMKTPAWISFSCRDGQHLNDGTAITQAAQLFAEHENVMAIGVNCTAPKYISELISGIKSVAHDKPVIVYPNSGELYDAASKSWQSTEDPIVLTKLVQSWFEQGARIIGGCCRIGPDKIQAIKDGLNA